MVNEESVNLTKLIPNYIYNKPRTKEVFINSNLIKLSENPLFISLALFHYDLS